MAEAGLPGTEAPETEMPDTDDRSVVNKALLTTNIASELDDEDLKAIANAVIDGYDADVNSRRQWEEQNNEWMKLATQIMETKTWPWENAANVKFPLLTTAALQFASRAYPSLISGFDVVKAKAIGNDPQGQAQLKAQDISTHMSYQLLYEMNDWEEDMDRLCFILPIIGCAFKKTYYSQKKQQNCSDLVLPKNLVVNYWAKSLEDAVRITHEIFLTPNEIKERQLRKVFLSDEELDKKLSQPGDMSVFNHGKQVSNEMDKTHPPSDDKMSPRLILEQHTWYDLDEDGYAEPWIVTVDYETRAVLRITARFEEGDIDTDEEGNLIGIRPCHYFTMYSFLPNPEGGFYPLGFGLLLGGINAAANTTINLLLDAGHLSNLQGGFISKGIRVKQGDMPIMPGQWKQVNNFGDDLKKGIFPLPYKEPSNVLFQLLGTLVQSGKELASVAEIFTGKMPGQNTPASTTMATIEQGLKVFTSIYKRIYRAMGREFEKLYRLNSIYMPESVDFTIDVAGMPQSKTVKKDDYQMPLGAGPGNQGKPFLKIVPAADPNMVSETQRLVKAQGLLELMQLGSINPQVATQRILEQQGQADIAQLMQMPPPQPPLEIQIEQMKQQFTAAEADKDRQLEAMKIMSENQKRQSEIMLNLAKAEEMGNSQNVEMLKQQYEQIARQQELMFEREKHAMNMQMEREKHNMTMQHDMEKGAIQALNAKQMGDIKAKQASAKPQAKGA